MTILAGYDLRVVAAGTRVKSVVTGEEAVVTDNRVVADGRRLYCTEAAYQFTMDEVLRRAPVAGAS